MNIFYVYIYKHPDTLLPFYVGKGKGNRYKVHLKLYKSDPNGYKKNIIRQILNEGKTPLIEFYAKDISEEEAFKLECDLIEKYGRRDQPNGLLCNMTPGGEGSSEGIPYKRTEEHRKNLSNMRKNSSWYYNTETLESRSIKHNECIPDGFIKGRDGTNWSSTKNGMHGVERSPEFAQKMSEWHKAHPDHGKQLIGRSYHTKESKLIISQKHKESYKNGRIANCAKSVTIDGVKYNSMRDAEKATGLSQYKLRQILLATSTE